MTSHDLARRLEVIARELITREEFELPSYQKDTGLRIAYFDNKEGFLKAVRAVGAGTKSQADYGEYLNFTPAFGDLKIQVNRNRVCTKVQEEKWECEPLLSESEEKELLHG